MNGTCHMRLALGLILCGQALSLSYAATNDEKVRLIKDYAPRVWLAEGEAYMPSSVEWAFKHLSRVKRDDGRYWLYTKVDLKSPSDNTLPLFKGELDTAPVYAFWVEKPNELERQLLKQGLVDTASTIDIVYFFYYPYNRGKEMVDTIWGNHVSDWEHITVRLRSQQGDDGSRTFSPEKVYVSAHDFGGSQPWDKVPKLQLSELARQILKEPASTTHPVIFSAAGSHGNYLAAGAHTYKKIDLLVDTLKLTDYCSEGTVWDTFLRVEAFDFNNRKGLDGATWPAWMDTNYSSDGGGANPALPDSGPIYRWGNGQNGCDAPGFITSECRLNDGPTGPIDKGVWNPDPTHFE